MVNRLGDTLWNVRATGADLVRWWDWDLWCCVVGGGGSDLTAVRLHNAARRKFPFSSLSMVVQPDTRHIKKYNRNRQKHKTKTSSALKTKQMRATHTTSLDFLSLSAEHQHLILVSFAIVTFSPFHDIFSHIMSIFTDRHRARCALPSEVILIFSSPSCSLVFGASFRSLFNFFCRHRRRSWETKRRRNSSGTRRWTHETFEN